MDPLVKYIWDGEHMNSKVERRKVRYKATNFVIIGYILYKRGFLLPLFRCVHPSEVGYVLQDVQEGSCASHVGGLSLAKRIVTQGY